MRRRPEIRPGYRSRAEDVKANARELFLIRGTNKFPRLHNELCDKGGALAEDNVNFSPQFSPEPVLHEKWVFLVRAADDGRLKFSSFRT